MIDGFDDGLHRRQSAFQPIDYLMRTAESTEQAFRQAHYRVRRCQPGDTLRTRCFRN